MRISAPHILRDYLHEGPISCMFHGLKVNDKLAIHLITMDRRVKWAADSSRESVTGRASMLSWSLSIVWNEEQKGLHWPHSMETLCLTQQLVYCMHACIVVDPPHLRLPRLVLLSLHCSFFWTTGSQGSPISASSFFDVRACTGRV